MHGQIETGTENAEVVRQAASVLDEASRDDGRLEIALDERFNSVRSPSGREPSNAEPLRSSDEFTPQ